MRSRRVAPRYLGEIRKSNNQKLKIKAIRIGKIWDCSIWDKISIPERKKTPWIKKIYKKQSKLQFTTLKRPKQ